MTDAAGSLPRDLARQHGITLLDSYILSGEAAQPESLCPASALYGQMRQGHKVRTAQASLLERHRLYQSITEHHGPTLYLATGSAYTGNYQVARAWQAAQGEECPLVVLDTGSASGRLAVLALLTRRLARKTREIQALRAQARDLALACREYIFPESLRYLVASGRISRTRGFLGDLLGKKPVISPFPDGARRVGMVSDEAGQLDFALARVAAEITRPARALVLLQYTDNQEWVTGTVRPRLAALLPEAELLLAPLSLTSGVHLGPGTWSLAFGEEP